ncbi:ImmA/IrrE family metallo-endopeptidase [Lachnospiraceae bacterium ASD3451]|uniref:ImmA/IrrE family metallo-endopeptidase n=1 Tax=Diplocloster agilis TaxID=2850323 RepID=UPI001E0FC8E6|nr:ImmA/IrrE family metallo-endopeptidase [Diplocloster agilis]MBU9746869.1 ImmA/IrrE family metallo-endopeptidase [Diplocloster agilis]
MNLAATALSRKKIRNLTEYVRKISGNDNNPYFPIVEFIELVLGDPDNPNFNYEIVEPWEMADMYGSTNTGTNVMKIRRDVYERAVKGIPRDRFTLCHELGHYLLHQPELMSYARGDVPRYRQPEWQANTFAGELMAPYKLVKNMNIEQIMDKCGMSRRAASIQYDEYHKGCIQR